MSMDLTGITNQNEYYTNHYFSSVFEENVSATLTKWRTATKDGKDGEKIRTPWSLLRDAARQYYPIHDRFLRARFDTQTLFDIVKLADIYLAALGYPDAKPEWISIGGDTKVPVYLELKKPSGAPALWILLAASEDKDAAILDKFCFAGDGIGEEGVSVSYKKLLTEIPNEDLVTKILFEQTEPPRFIVLLGMNQIALIDRNKWNEKRYLQFELEEIFSRHEETTLEAMAVLLHRDSLCPAEGSILLDDLDSNSQKHAAGVSQDLKYALRECIELLGNEVLYDMAHRQGRDLNAAPVDAGQLTLECLRYMYRMLFVLFIESRPELGYAPIKAQSYLSGYSLESLRDIADDIRDDVTEVGCGYFLHETLSKLYDLIYNGYPEKEEDVLKYSGAESLHDMFVIAPLKAHIFDPEYTRMIANAKLRNSVMLRIIDLMSLTRETGKKNDRRGRISYANLGINQMGSVYEALLSYRGFIADHTLFEVKRAGDKFNELDVGYFVSEEDLDQYTEDERVRYEKDDPSGRYKKGQLRKYEKGTFIYRLAGREREKSASYYTPECLTKCLVKYALKELLEGKTADEILHLTVCEPAMGSAAFLNEAINQLAEAYLDRKQKELGEMIPADQRLKELQKVKMFIADRNVYGIDLNPVAVELAEVSLWLNTIYEGGFVPWFGTQLVNGNSLIGARRQVYSEKALVTNTKGKRWFENAPDRVPLGTERKKKRGSAQIYHFLLGDPGMCSYTDEVINSLESDNIETIKAWNKKFTAPYEIGDLEMLRGLSDVVDNLWENQIKLRRTVETRTRDTLSVYGYHDTIPDSHTTIRQKDEIYSKLYKSEHMKNAGPYARLKFAMDYWCALWFWPIDKADLLPSRSEFLNDLNLILVGAFSTKVNPMPSGFQTSLFPTEEEEQREKMVLEIRNLFPDHNVVDIDNLCTLLPRLALVRKIAEQNHFMHWELEFADLFADRGGFDLVVGNPPWIKIEWKIEDLLSEFMPLIVIRKNDKFNLITDAANRYIDVLLSEYIGSAGQLSFLSARSNYIELCHQYGNVYKNFVVQVDKYLCKQGVYGLLHPEGLYDNPKGEKFREYLFKYLRYHFEFINENKFFHDVAHTKRFSINIAKKHKANSFITITNLFSTTTIDECFEHQSNNMLMGLKDSNNNWNVYGHPRRKIVVDSDVLKLFGKIFDGKESLGARMPEVHADICVEFFKIVSQAPLTIGDVDGLYCTQLMNESTAKNNKLVVESLSYPSSMNEFVYSGPNLWIGNPFFKSAKYPCVEKSDYNVVNLSYANTNKYIPRSKFATTQKCYKELPILPNGTKYNIPYKIFARRRLNLSMERTLISAIVPKNTVQIHSVLGISVNKLKELVTIAGCMNTIIYDFYIKVYGKDDFYENTLVNLPIPSFDEGVIQIRARTLCLNAIGTEFEELWNNVWESSFTNVCWTKNDKRLPSSIFLTTNEWKSDYIATTDYMRRQLLVELDVLVAYLLGISLQLLLSIYHMQFPVLRKYESDTWYDSEGKIVFTNNKGLPNVGFSRGEWENGIKGAPAGKKFYRVIMDDTMPGGPVERTIEYVAPFDRCDREKDYETAWKFFEEKYGKPAKAD
ncbi:Eco57I restriction-modification methylase domain-containing protein [Succinimonas sp.]|uniref:Eco57I restriction-modification methylase domain-containing protein n=1 Tax=Succinimonas sp. TaxID=1936151 RepID=UPI00386CA213